jgi:hypothetical protein
MREIRESGNQEIRESGNQGIRKSGNQGIRESGNQLVSLFEKLEFHFCLFPPNYFSDSRINFYTLF